MQIVLLMKLSTYSAAGEGVLVLPLVVVEVIEVILEDELSSADLSGRVGATGCGYGGIASLARYPGGAYCREGYYQRQLQKSSHFAGKKLIALLTLYFST